MISKTDIICHQLGLNPEEHQQDEPSVILTGYLLTGNESLFDEGKDFLELLNDSDKGIDAFLNNHPHKATCEQYTKQQVYQWYGSVFVDDNICPYELTPEHHKKSDTKPASFSKGSKPPSPLYEQAYPIALKLVEQGETKASAAHKALEQVTGGQYTTTNLETLKSYLKPSNTPKWHRGE